MAKAKNKVIELKPEDALVFDRLVNELEDFLIRKGIKRADAERKLLAKGFRPVTSKEFAHLTRFERSLLEWRVCGRKRFVRPRQRFIHRGRVVTVEYKRA